MKSLLNAGFSLFLLKIFPQFMNTILLKSKWAFSIMFLCCCFSVNAQKNTEITRPEMPIDEETKIVNYKGVVELSGVTKDELYQ